VNHWLFLLIAIFGEVMATSALKSSAGFTQLWPSLLVIAGYLVAFFFLSLTLRTMPVGVAYAIWSGVGIVLITLIAWFVLGQSLDGPAIVGLTLIVAGGGCFERIFGIGFQITSGVANPGTICRRIIQLE
jgi:small multidrug resistance pump